MKLLRAIVLAVLVVGLIAGVIVSQAALATRLTLLSGDFLVRHMHREGAFALLYARATDAIDDEAAGLSDADRSAARAALRSLMEQRILEEAIADAAARFRAAIRGDTAMVAVDMREFKRAAIEEFAVAGASQDALSRFETSLADLPDDLTALEQGWVDRAPPWVRRAADNAPLVLASVVLILALALCLIGGARTGLGLTGLSFFASGGALFAAANRLRVAVAASGYRLASVDQLQLDPATTGQLHSALVGLVSRALGQARLVTGIAALIGLCLIVAASLWRSGYGLGSPVGAHGPGAAGGPSDAGSLGGAGGSGGPSRPGGPGSPGERRGTAQRPG